MTDITYLLVFVFGTAIGSFLNVVIWRYRPERPVFDVRGLRGRSHCPYCQKTLSAPELVPFFSFLFQFGRCRSCRHRLSFQYPLVELLGGVVLLFVPLFLNSFYSFSNERFFSLESPPWYYGLVLAWVLVFFIFLLVAAIDFKHYVIPNGLNLSLALLGLVIAAIVISHQGALPAFRDSFMEHYALVFSPFDSGNPIMSRVIGTLTGGLFFGALIILSRGRAMGMGDVKLAAALGLVFGWPDMGLVLIATFIFGGLAGLVLLLLKKKGMKDRVPFGPFLIFGSTSVFLFGSVIIEAYFRLFNVW